MYGFDFDEDEYWERVRERIENPPRHPWDDPPEPEHDCYFLDDTEDEILEKYGYPVGELGEAEWWEIVNEKTGLEPEEVQYNDQFYCLDYTYREDEDY